MRREVEVESPGLAIDLTHETETFTIQAERVVHRLDAGELSVEASVPYLNADPGDAKGAWWRAYLKGFVPQPSSPFRKAFRSVDLFCGSGGLALGVRQLCRELGLSLVPELIVDLDDQATAVYAASHGARRRLSESVSRLVDFAVRRTTAGAMFPYLPELVDVEVADGIGVDVVLAGPPCQGHSNLNNHTRRDDPRNHLYLTVPAFAVAVGAPTCIIENVPAVLNDSDDVVAIAKGLLESSGYFVAEGLVSASSMGWPQTRKRHFLVARRDRPPLSLDAVARILADEETRSGWWAIGDLEDVESDSVLDQHTELSSDNVDRISWLFENDSHDLALPERPESHRNGTSYQAVYGRMYVDRPAQTITTGFMSPGRGRYIHPTRRRVITAHEAARLQGFPDDYVFVPDPLKPPTRYKLAKWIGEAVPMPLGYAAALSALAGGLPR